ncbi:MAG TPA: protein kinase [Gemmatimonadales bacterium]|nr:protein kinase [Gemmatimonadales bacterium]
MTLPTPERWAEIERLLDGALELASEERAEWLGRMCAEDPGLRAEVERLLEACDAAGPFLEEPAPVAAAALVTRVDVGDVLEPGDRVGSYEIVRELGRGGMAVVYLAHDLKHDRSVALKTLHPEIAAGLGPERFLREIRLTARLQHPHILSVFDSGAIDGRPWYTMPYVRGESLRDRLQREVRLPVETAVEITRQVALALEYAHREGTVHRDIKPENVLMSDGQALVADFGIARAIGAAAEESRTGTEAAIGTPFYMAPEQASGGQVDGRTDVYALGCVLYEMLAGSPPFTGPTVHEIISKRFAHSPPSLRLVRPSVEATVDEAITRAMALAPADRFSSVAQFAQALTPLTPSATRAPSTRPGLPRRLVMAAAIAAAVLGLTAAGLLALRALRPQPATLLSTGVLKEREPVLIADFESRTHDSIVGPAVTEAFRIDFAGSPVVTVLPPDRVSRALSRMRRPATTRLDAALAREVAVREGIKAIVTGQVSRLSGSFLLSAQLVSAATGEVLAAHRETAADSTQVIAAIDRLSGRLRERIGESLRSLRGEPPLTQVTTSSLEALWKYTQGQLAGDAGGDYVNAVALLKEAVALDSGFATAYRTLGGFQAFLGNRTEAVAAMTKAIRHDDRLTDIEREHTRGNYHVGVTGQLDQAIAAYRAALEVNPDDSLASHNLGMVYYLMHQPERAESIFRAELDTLHPWSPGFHFTLTLALVALGRPAEAEEVYRQVAILFPGQRAVERWGILMAASRGDYITAAVGARTFRDRNAEGPLDRADASRWLAEIALARGRLAEAGQHIRDAMAASVDAGHPADYLKDAASLGFIDIWFRRRPMHGLGIVEAALARYPLDAIPLLDRPYVTIAFIYASAGQPGLARALLTRYAREVHPTLRHIDEPRRQWTVGQVSLAEGRYADAVAEFQAYVQTPRHCLPCGQAALAEAYDRLGNSDSAIAVYERYVKTPSVFRAPASGLGLTGLYDQGLFSNDATQLAPSYKRLGELFEQRGDRAKARYYYSSFVELWKDSDAELKPEVSGVRRRLQQLGGERSEGPETSTPAPETSEPAEGERPQL